MARHPQGRRNLPQRWMQHLMKIETCLFLITGVGEETPELCGTRGVYLKKCCNPHSANTAAGESVMTSDPRIQRIARLLAEKHGDDSLAIATERAYDRVAIQDYPSAIIWTRVAEAVHLLLPGAKPQRASGRIGASLDELMDDPVMTAVVQDDEGRRGEIRATLTSAKHKLRRNQRKR